MFASLRKFPVNCAYKQLTKFFYWKFAQNIIKCQFCLLWYWKC
jgi:hypothetical protein